MTTRTKAIAAEKATKLLPSNDNKVKSTDNSFTAPLISKPTLAYFKKLTDLPIAARHLVLGILLRAILILAGELIDKHMQVPFTDVDYNVFTDAARHVTKGHSPYLRDTYRYSPLIAYICIPNIYIHEVFAKVLFCSVDVLTSFIIFKVALLFSTPKLSKISCLIWLYNPVSLIISARGNADSIICSLVLLTLYFRLHNKTVLTGLFLAFSIHLRMYPLLFSLPLFLSLRSIRQRGILVASCVGTLGVLSAGFYYLYGDKFIAESYLYHLSRADIKHNYSVHFLSQYLDVSSPFLKFVPTLILQVLCAVRFYHLNDLPLCLFLQCYLFVTFSPVLTCQYFIWYISLFIPILPGFINTKQIAVRFALWLVVQLLWLVPAYYLEYQGSNVFSYVGVMCAAFFLVNVNIIIKLIEFYRPMKKIQ